MTCRVCGATKPVTKFPTVDSATGRRGTECRACRDARRALARGR